MAERNRDIERLLSEQTVKLTLAKDRLRTQKRVFLGLCGLVGCAAMMTSGWRQSPESPAAAPEQSQRNVRVQAPASPPPQPVVSVLEIERSTNSDTPAIWQRITDGERVSLPY